MKYVTNPLDRPVVLRSFDGNSVQIPAKVRRAPVADKFDWSVPAGVRVEDGPADKVDPTQVVTTPVPEPAITPPKDSAEALAVAKQLADDQAENNSTL